MRTRAWTAPAGIAVAIVTMAGGAGAVTAAAAAPASGPSAQNGSVKVHVHPAVGGPHAKFAVSFRVPASGGSSPSTTSRSYELSVTGTRHSGCASSDSVPIGSPAPGTRVTTALRPPSPRRRWCGGRFAGKVEEIVRPTCSEGVVCPMFIALVTIGRFHFRVR